MSQTPACLRDRLLVQNEEFRQLDQQHHEFERRLSALSEKAVLSEDEQIEATNLKKRKLLLKDRMEAIVRQARQEACPT